MCLNVTRFWIFRWGFMEEDPKLVVEFPTAEQAEAVSEHLPHTYTVENLMFVDEEGLDLDAIIFAADLEGIDDKDYQTSRIE